MGKGLDGWPAWQTHCSAASHTMQAESYLSSLEYKQVIQGLRLVFTACTPTASQTVN